VLKQFNDDSNNNSIY